MWKSKVNRIFYFLILLLLAVSCKTKNVQKTAIGEEMYQNGLEYSTLNVPKATFTLAQKQSSVNVNGSIRICKDSIIIISFQFLGTEVARAGITQHSLALVDRWNKRYFEADFDSLKAQTGVNINYNIFQAVLTNSLFIYDKPGQVPVSAFEEVRIGDVSLLLANSGGVSHEFNVDEKKRVLSGRLLAEGGSYFIGWSYQDFTPLENGYIFPHSLKTIVPDGNGQNRVDIAYNKVELNKKLNFQFSIPDSYTKVTLGELLKILQ